MTDSYEIIMFKGNAVVEASRMIVSDHYKIRKLQEYAKMMGYEFSCTNTETKEKPSWL